MLGVLVAVAAPADPCSHGTCGNISLLVSCLFSSVGDDSHSFGFIQEAAFWAPELYVDRRVLLWQLGAGFSHCRGTTSFSTVAKLQLDPLEIRSIFTLSVLLTLASSRKQDAHLRGAPILYCTFLDANGTLPAYDCVEWSAA